MYWTILKLGLTIANLMKKSTPACYKCYSQMTACPSIAGKAAEMRNLLLSRCCWTATHIIPCWPGPMGVGVQQHLESNRFPRPDLQPPNQSQFIQSILLSYMHILLDGKKNTQSRLSAPDTYFGFILLWLLINNPGKCD